jgi:5-formyltetrahydrofolate cyclo-ligase
MNLRDSKAALRLKIRSELKNVLPEKKAADSAKIRTLLRQQAFWQNASSLLCFAPRPEEVDIWPLLEEALVAGKIVALPRFESSAQTYAACRVQNLRNEITAGQFGIREPDSSCVEMPPHKLDLVLVPGVAFDSQGHRLGRGKGFYDRLLIQVRGVKCGIAFDEQLVDAIPAEAHDVRMNFILTPTRGLNCDGGQVA